MEGISSFGFFGFQFICVKGAVNASRQMPNMVDAQKVSLLATPVLSASISITYAKWDGQGCDRFPVITDVAERSGISEFIENGKALRISENSHFDEEFLAKITRPIL